MLNSDMEYNRFHYKAKAIKLLSDADTTEIGFIPWFVSTSSLSLPL
jgi:hypothetical protein